MTEVTEGTQTKFFTPGRIIATVVVMAMIAGIGYEIFFGGAHLVQDSGTTLPAAAVTSGKSAAPDVASAPALPPDYLVPSIDGGTFRLSDYRGKVLVMDFWATWCPPCQAETPELVRLSKQYSSQGVSVVGLHIDDRGRSSLGDIRSFIKSYNVPYTVGLATDGMFTTYLGTKDDTIPQTLVFDRQGKVVAHLVGFDPSHADALENAVKRAMSGS